MVRSYHAHHVTAFAAGPRRPIRRVFAQAALVALADVHRPLDASRGRSARDLVEGRAETLAALDVGLVEGQLAGAHGALEA